MMISVLIMKTSSKTLPGWSVTVTHKVALVSICFHKFQIDTAASHLAQGRISK